jgi:hypothetical protein
MENWDTEDNEVVHYTAEKLYELLLKWKKAYVLHEKRLDDRGG